jgi:microsomal epoxide hydrolase
MATKLMLRGCFALLIAATPTGGTAARTADIAVAPGVVLYTIESGPAAGRPTIVFIPGWSTSTEIWQGQIDRFDDKFRVIAFDPRSQGKSTKTTNGNTPEQRAVDLHSLLARKKVDRPVLVGWSQAAQDVAAYVLRYGTADLSGIVLVDAAVADGAKGITQRPREAAFQFQLFGTYLHDQDAYLRGMFSAIVSKPQPSGVIDRAVATGMKTPPSIGIAMLVSDLFTSDRTGALAKMNCPVMIIAAARSGELDRQKAQAQAIKNARFVEIEDAAHAVFLDQPDRFATAVEGFVEGVGRP